MENQIMQVAERIRGLRMILDISLEKMAEITGLSVEEYLKYENGEKDFSFTFLYQCSQTFGVDIAELVTGEMPKLSVYTVVRKDEGMPIERRQGFKYLHQAYLLKDRLSEPYLVKAIYSEKEQSEPIHLSRHEGQEFDYVLKGKLKFQLDDHVEILNEGDSIYYDSSYGHGMIATDGKDCEFLAVVLKPQPDIK